MTRRCADSVTAANLPEGFGLYAAYIDGHYANYAQVKARFPTTTVIAIAVFASTAAGDCLDVEAGDATPQQAPGWVRSRRAAGHVGPLVYCSESVWPQVRQQFVNQAVTEPGYWIAGYPGSAGAGNLYAGSVGHQWIDHGPYDESVFVDYLIGIDPIPAPEPGPPGPLPPLPLPIKEGTMSIAVLPNGEVAISAVGAGNRADHLLVFTLAATNPNAPNYNVIDVTAGIGTANPYTVASA